MNKQPTKMTHHPAHSALPLPLESNKTHQYSICNHAQTSLHGQAQVSALRTAIVGVKKEGDEDLSEDNGREKLKRHRIEVAGQVWIPDIWGQEEMLKDWIDCAAFDASLASTNIMSARSALAQEGRRSNPGGLRIENRC